VRLVVPAGGCHRLYDCADRRMVRVEPGADCAGDLAWNSAVYHSVWFGFDFGDDRGGSDGDRG
jgi:hypothetical protein